jgi:hypothetical protein
LQEGASAGASSSLELPSNSNNVGYYKIFDNDAIELGKIELNHKWRKRQPEMLKFVLIAVEVEGGVFELPPVFTVHPILIETRSGISCRVNIPEDFFLEYEDWVKMERRWELIVLV